MRPHPASLRYQEKLSTSAGKIAFQSRNGVHYVNINDILYCQADGNYCRVLLNNGEQLMISKTLKWVASQLPEDLFVRVHSGYLVQVRTITILGSNYVCLECGTKVPLSRSRKCETRKKLSDLD